MRGLILLPIQFKHSYLVTKRYMPLFILCKERLGFDVRFGSYTICDGMELSKYDVIVAFKIPEKAHPRYLENLYKLDRSVRLITYHQDVHNNQNRDGDDYRYFKKNMGRILGRADKVLCSYDYCFKRLWPEFVDKYEFFPQFFAPYKYFKSLGINKNPMKKCFLSGSIYFRYYMLRKYIYRKRDKDKIVYLPHPGYKRKKREGSLIGRDFFNEMRKYFCAISTSSILKCPVAKYFEIPATGALLIANHIPDLDKLGFKDMVNYVRINKKNALEKIYYVLNHTGEFEHVRRAGRKLVFEHHSEINRFKRLKEVLNEVIDAPKK